MSSVFGGSKKKGFRFTGDAAWKNRIRHHMLTQGRFCGMTTKQIDNCSLRLKLCPPTRSHWVCDPGCSEVQGCVGGWVRWGHRASGGMMMLATNAPDWVVAHEVGHITIARWAATLAMIMVREGHPGSFQLKNGRTIKVDQMLGAGVRWPLRVPGLRMSDKLVPIFDNIPSIHMDDDGNILSSTAIGV